MSILGLMLMSGCSSNAPQVTGSTATARAERAIGQATQIAQRYQATRAIQREEVHATQQAQQALIGQAQAWTLQIADSFDANELEWAQDEQDDPAYAAIRWSIVDGVYLWEATAYQGFVWWVIPDSSAVEDFYAAVDARQTDNRRDGEYGIVFRADESGSYYLYEMNVGGEYGVFLYDEVDGWQTIVDWKMLPDFDSQHNARLGVLAQGSNFWLLMDDSVLAKFTDERLPSGRVGLLAGLSTEGESASWEFDNLELRTP